MSDDLRFRSPLDDLKWMDDAAEWIRSTSRIYEAAVKSYWALPQTPEDYKDLKKWMKAIGPELAKRGLGEFVESSRAGADEEFKHHKTVRNAVQAAGWQLFAAGVRDEKLDRYLRDWNSTKLSEQFDTFFRCVNPIEDGPRTYCHAMADCFRQWENEERKKYELQLCDLLNSHGIDLRSFQTWLYGNETGLSELEIRYAKNFASYRLKQKNGIITSWDSFSSVANSDTDNARVLPARTSETPIREHAKDVTKLVHGSSLAPTQIVASSHPIQTPEDCARVEKSLRLLLTALESDPVRRSTLSLAWDEFRRAFRGGSTPEGVIHDSTGLPDLDGLPVLIRLSIGISSEARDALEEVASTVVNVGGHACVFQDAEGDAQPTSEQIRLFKQNFRLSDNASLRQARSDIRNALNLMCSTPKVIMKEQSTSDDSTLVNNRIWNDLGAAKQAVLTVLNVRQSAMLTNEIARKSGYTQGTLRHHLPALVKLKLISKLKLGYVITDLGKAQAQCEPM